MNRTIALIALPLAAAALLIGVPLLRSRNDEDSSSARRRPAPAPTGRSEPVSFPSPAAAPELRTAWPSKDASAAVYDSRVRTTFDNYRAAVSTGNAALMEALRPVLLRDRTTALRLARQDLDRAGTPLERDISSQILDMLERSR